MIGINLGSLNTSVAIGAMERNKFKSDLILSETSSRNSPSVITYGKRHRLIGDQAGMKLKKYLASSLMYINRIIGLCPGSEFAEKELKEYSLTEIPFEVSSSTELGSSYVLFKLLFNGIELQLPNEATIAAYINKIKQIYLIEGNKPFNCITFSVPDFFAITQREALSRAIRICDISNFNIINESTAITLYYGYSRYKDIFTPELDTKTKMLILNPNSVKYVIFIDAGHSKTSFILSKFQPVGFRVVYTYVHPYFGGRAFDELIFNYCCKVFYNRNHIDISTNKKVKLRLMEQIAKARKILTANNESIISVDAIFEDYDFSLVIKRDEFEAIIKDLLDVFAQNFNEFYKQSLARIDIAISQIEMAGDLMRTPALMSIVKSITGKELSRGIITDECISKGCTINSALLNHLFPIPGLQWISHANPYSIFYAINTTSNVMASQAQKVLLLPRFEAIPARQQIVVPVLEISSCEKIVISFYYSKDETEFIISSIDSLLFEYEITVLALANAYSLQEANSLVLDIVIDSGGKAFFAEMWLQQGDKLILIQGSTEIIHSLGTGLYTRPSQDEEFIIKYKEIEMSHLQADEEYKTFHMKKNQLETELYNLKNHCIDKNLLQVEKEGRPLIERLNSIENHLITADADDENIQMSYLDSEKKKLNEISSMISKPQKLESEYSPEQIMLLNKIKAYEEKISFEYANILSGNTSKLNEEAITKIGDLLSFYRGKCDNAKGRNEVYIISQSLDREMRKYFS